MQQLAKYDPYAITEVQCFIEKKTQYTTLKSILVSMVIFVLTIFLSWTTINDLWAPLSQLSIQSSDQKQTNSNLTSGYICAISKYLNQSMPNTEFLNYNYTSSQYFQTFQSTNAFNFVPQILTVASGRQFRCYDVNGGVVNIAVSLQLRAYGQVEVMLKTITLSQILGQQPSNYYVTAPNFASRADNQIVTSKIDVIFMDSLLMSYTPNEIIALTPNINEYNNLDKSKQATYVSTWIFSENTRQRQVTQQITITRNNIGQILGIFFSWFSILVLIFTYLIAPIVQYNFKVSLAQSIYKNTKVDKIEASIMSYIKYLASMFSKRCFDEGILEKTFERLQKDMDILNLIKNQSIMKSLIKEHQQIQGKKQEQQENKVENQVDAESIVELFVSDSNKYKDGSQETNRTQVLVKNEQKHCQFQVCKDETASNYNIVSGAIVSLDCGQTTISLITNKGQGYKTSWNTILAVVFLFGVFGFLIFSGTFTYTTNFNYLTVLEADHILQTKTITIQPKDMIFRARKTMMDHFTLVVMIGDQTFTGLYNVSVLNGSACDSYVQNLNQTGTGWMCFNQSITLSNNGKHSSRNLHFMFNFTGFLRFTNTPLQIVYKERNIENNQFADNIIKISLRYQVSYLYKYDMQLIQLIDTAGNVQNHWTSFLPNVLTSTPLNGIAFAPMRYFQKIEETENTIWDVINTAWGIFILIFTVILSKLANYLNVREREKITCSDQNQNRNDLRALLSKEFTLKRKYFRPQLCSVGYFFKKKLQ